MRFIWIVFTLWVFSSCMEELDLHTHNLVPVTFIPVLDENDVADPSTRATNNTWTAGDRVGVYMLNGSNYTLSSALSSNVQYSAASTATSTALNAVSTPVYYPVNGDNVRFVAYSPYVSGAESNGHQATYIFTTQNTKAAKESKDFIFHRGTTNYNKNFPNASLVFSHKFCKINITVRQGANGPSTSGLTMELTKMPLNASCDLSKLAVNENDATALSAGVSSTTISAYTSTSSATSASVEAIVAPHTGSGGFTGRTFVFSAGGYTYNLPNDVTFQSGKVYNFDFTLTQTAAVLTDSNITNWDGGEISWTGEYTMSLSPSSFSFTKEARSGNSLIIKTNFPTAPGIQFSSNAISVETQSELTQNSFTRIGTDRDPYTYELKFSLTSTTTNRDRYIHITIGDKTYVVPVNQSQLGITDVMQTQPSSNCYIVAPGSAPIAIPVSRANEFTTGAIGSSTAFTTELVWSDTNGGNNTGIGAEGCIARIETRGTGSTGHIIVYPGRREGNAVVAVKVGDEIKWSWHIWVTTYNPWQGYAESGEQLMTRSLGAVYTDASGNMDALNPRAGGLYYQWSRKDPFPVMGTTYYNGSGIIQSEDDSWTQLLNNTYGATATLAQSIRTPLLWYGYTYGSSIDVGADNNWNNNEVVITDPCPVGYRVATYDKILQRMGTGAYWNYATDEIYYFQKLFAFSRLHYNIDGAKSTSQEMTIWAPSSDNPYRSPLAQWEGSSSFLQLNLVLISTARGYPVRCMVAE